MSGKRGASGAKRGIPRAVTKRDKQHSRLYQLRMERNLSQRELAEQAGITRNTIMRIENGDVDPSIDSCRKICSALGVKVTDVFDL